MSPHAEERYRQGIKELQKSEEDDPEFFLDDLGTDAENFQMTKDGRIVQK